MTIPVWLAAVIAGTLIAQLAGAVAWAINARQELALLRHSIQSIESKLDRHDLAVLAASVARLETDLVARVNDARQAASAAHERNKERIDDIYRILDRAHS